MEEIHWHTCFTHFNQAVKILEKSLDRYSLNELEEIGLVKTFELAFDLGVKTLNELLEKETTADLLGAGPVIEEAGSKGFITDEKSWLQMLAHRNKTGQAYQEEVVKEIVKATRKGYFSLFQDLQVSLEEERTGDTNPFFDIGKKPKE